MYTEEVHWSSIFQVLKSEVSHHMIQQSHYWACTQRKPQFQRMCVPQCSLKHSLPQPGCGSNLNVHGQTNGQRRCDICVQYNGILLSHNKGTNWVIWKDMDGPQDCHTELSQKKKQISYLYTYMWNLEKMIYYLICKAVIETQTKNKHGYRVEKRSGMN